MIDTRLPGIVATFSYWLDHQNVKLKRITAIGVTDLTRDQIVYAIKAYYRNNGHHSKKPVKRRPGGRPYGPDNPPPRKRKEL